LIAIHDLKAGGNLKVIAFSDSLFFSERAK
jgi:hypothetical protein